MATRKIGPAVAAGCTSVLKPAALTPLTALAFTALLEEAGLPVGAVNTVPTSSAGALTFPLLADPRLRKLSFTGSTPVGRTLLRASAERVLRTSMELGGNAPFIVFEDADLDLALEAARTAKLRNGGEACTAANRFLVHASVEEEFTFRLAADFASLNTGPGLRPSTDVGPLIDEHARASVHGLVSAAIGGGAVAMTGAEVPAGHGFFYPPTVLASVTADSPVVREEVFGPVAPVVAFRDEEEALDIANAVSTGLAGYVFTEDLTRLLRLSEDLEVGMIGVNQGAVSNPAAPFGGLKESGLGREGGREGIAEYLETVYAALPDPRAAKITLPGAP